MFLDHPSAEQLAAMAEARLGASSARTVREHLAGCRSCMAAYCDAVRYRAAWLAVPDEFTETPPDWASSRTRRARGLARLAAAAALAIGLTGAVVLGLRLSSTAGRTAALPAPFHDHLAALSARGLVMPGFEENADDVRGVERGGPGNDDALGPLLDGLRHDYESSRRSRVATRRLLEALIATGRIEEAAPVAETGFRRFQNDAPLAELEAILAWRQGDLDRAAMVLERLLSAAPEDPTARLNLGLIELDRGRFDDARRHLERVLTLQPGTALARRAETSLARIPG